MSSNLLALLRAGHCLCGSCCCCLFQQSPGRCASNTLQPTFASASASCWWRSASFSCGTHGQSATNESAAAMISQTRWRWRAAETVTASTVCAGVSRATGYTSPTATRTSSPASSSALPACRTAIHCPKHREQQLLRTGLASSLVGWGVSDVFSSPASVYRRSSMRISYLHSGNATIEHSP